MNFLRVGFQSSLESQVMWHGTGDYLNNTSTFHDDIEDTEAATGLRPGFTFLKLGQYG